MLGLGVRLVDERAVRAQLRPGPAGRRAVQSTLIAWLALGGTPVTFTVEPKAFPSPARIPTTEVTPETPLTACSEASPIGEKLLVAVIA